MNELPIGDYKLVLGSTLNSNKKSSKKYHNLQYDFKPRSSAKHDVESFVQLESDGNAKVAVLADEEKLTIFNGKQKPANKEYLLFFDPTTGTCSLELLHGKISVKKTRDFDDDERVMSLITKLKMEEGMREEAEAEKANLSELKISADGDFTNLNVSSTERRLKSAAAKQRDQVATDESPNSKKAETSVESNMLFIDETTESSGESGISSPPVVFFSTPTIKIEKKSPPKLSAALIDDLFLSESSSDDE